MPGPLMPGPLVPGPFMPGPLMPARVGRSCTWVIDSTGSRAHEVRDGQQRNGRRTERLQLAFRLGDEVVRSLDRALDTEQARERGLACQSVLVRGLAELLWARRHVENVIDDLKSEAERLCEARHPADHVLVSARQHRTGDDGRLQQRTGLVCVDELEGGEADVVAAFGLQVDN